MSDYKCKYGLYHDKPVINNEPRSNNGWIYSAYSKYLIPESLDQNLTYRTFQQCVIKYNPVMINRLPNKDLPPLSKDEVIGMVSLGLLKNDDLEKSHYNFCNINNQFNRKLSFKSVWKAAKILYSIKDEHRNYVWNNGMVDAYPLSFRLPPEDIYYVKNYNGVSASIFESVAFYLNAIMTIRKGDKSSRMLLWLKLEDMNHWLKRFVNKDKWVRDYFGPDHDFVKALK